MLEYVNTDLIDSLVLIKEMTLSTKKASVQLLSAN